MKKFAVFDIDGTLIRWQLYHTLVDRLAKQDTLGNDVSKKLHEARMRWKRRESGFGFSDYEKVLIKSYESALKNIPSSVFDQLVLEIIDEYKDQVYTFTRNLIIKLKAEGYFLIAISGSHHELVGHIAQHYGFNTYAGSIYERTAGGFSGKKMVASHNKSEILNNFIKQHHLSKAESYAVGDSQSDVGMLEMTENPIAFNPNKQLFEIAKNRGWNIVLERKNMIYSLEFKNGQYVLVL